MPEGADGIPAPVEDEQKKWLYFAIPGQGSKDPYSGQYLRLYSAIGQAEQPHIPEAAFSGPAPPLTPSAQNSFKSATISAKGVYILKADQKLKETFGNALTEVVRQGDHDIQVVDGDWYLTSEKGLISIKANATDENGTISLESEEANIVVKAKKGTTLTLQGYSKSVSQGDFLDWVLGAELSWTNGLNSGKYYGLNFKLSVSFEVSTYSAASVSVALGAGDAHNKSFDFSVYAVNANITNSNFYITSSIRAFVLNKICTYDVSKVLNRSVSSKLSLSDDMTRMDKRLVKARKAAVDQGWADLMVINA
ncbi:hypothetical protein ABVF61_07860 [Roseibium sp. HPY-6]|uniref:hypothetical protein n=1 Tax=Roseibium sp. HPY-6 TaxID=3229852 RepID=UPI00338EF4B3